MTKGFVCATYAMPVAVPVGTGATTVTVPSCETKLPLGTYVLVAATAPLVTNSTAPYSDPSLLHYPINPTELSVNHTSQFPSNHTSHTALVYEHSVLPTTWPYVLASIFISFLITLFGTFGLLEVRANRKPVIFGHFRMPSIVHRHFAPSPRLSFAPVRHRRKLYHPIYR
jgi:hypothetical protein